MNKCLATLLILFSSHAFAVTDPTGGKPFLPWLWQDQFKPTIQAAGSGANLSILGSGVVATSIARQYDFDTRVEYGDNRHMPSSLSRYGSLLGSGAPGIGTAIVQLFVDQPNGLKHGRALALTSFSAFSMALIAQRERPNGHKLSFPSGHTSSSFATATSLAYSYGPWVGVPAYLAAGFVGVSRVADNAHWFSDIVGGATLGIFWGRASALAETPPKFAPVLLPGGAAVAYTADF